MSDRKMPDIEYHISLSGPRWELLDNDLYFRIVKVDSPVPHQHTFAKPDRFVSFDDGCTFELARKKVIYTW